MYTAYWLIKAAAGRLQPFEKEIVAHHFGWTSPEMRVHFRRLRRAGWRDLVHALVNIRVEWTRLHPQRAAKMSTDAEVALIAVAWVVAQAV